MRGLSPFVLLACACATSVAPPPREAPTAANAPPVTATAANKPTTDAETFDSAQVARDRGDDNTARMILVDMIKKSPDSRFVPDAWLALAEMSFARSDMKTAEQEYLQVVRFPPPTNLGYGYAWYKLAYVFWNDDRGDRALDAFKKVIDWSAKYPQNQGAAQLRRDALRDLVPVFSQFGVPNRAYSFFRFVVGDDRKAIAMLTELAESYRSANKVSDAHTVYQELLTRDTEHGCENDVHARYTVPGVNPALEDAELKNCR